MDKFQERSTRTYRQKQMLSKAELEAREKVCIYDEPAFCAAACPLKLDGRAFVAKMKEGDFTGGRAMLERIAPFPLILAGGCESPCAAACRLSEMGEGIGMSALERAAVKYGTPKGGRGMFKIKKSKKAAVLGGDLFTLALAGELAAKSYPVTFFVEEQNATALMARCAPFLDKEAQAAEAQRLCGMEIDLVYGSRLDGALFTRAKEAYDIACLSEEARKALLAEEPDPDTLVCAGAGVVAGTPEAAWGTLAALYSAKRAALSVDRLAQGMDPAASRGAEGPVVSRLYTDLSGAVPSKRVPEGEGYTPGEAKAEAGRCIQCRCEECFKGCAYLAHYGKSPKALTREIYNNVSIIMGDHTMNKPINSCALCGQCAVTCPHGYDMADICHMARENMVATGKMPLAPHEFALYDMLFSNGEAFLARPQEKDKPSKYVFFPGCQTAALSPATVAAAYRDLAARLPGGVALMLGCCGAIADWAGRYELLGETTEFLKNELAKLHDPELIAGCPTCKKTLEKTLGRKVLNIYEVLADLGVSPPQPEEGRSVVLHDACGARGDAAMRAAVEKIAGEVGLSVKKAADSGDRTPCCGYGGLVMYANREVAHEMAEKCTGLEGAYVTYCMNCKDRFAREGKESAHILELVYGIPPGQPPDISEKRKNRLQLKKDLLKACWGEQIEEEMTDFPLEITPQARALMDDRMILDADVIRVIKDYRKTGEAVFDGETGLLTARSRVGNVTFWAVFEERDGGYLVHRAYSHRMTVS
ncbi:MAG TPA: 4Fe-4S dicluster domain-containing protein [Candidatus Acidoferrum sp.]|nr:4Fe-4S dicluster domain-containing protein [Candidatus Acidoferrum sp.]